MKFNSNISDLYQIRFGGGGGTVPYSPKCYLSTRAQVCEIVFNLKLKRKQNSN